jgi:hypothetical protein
MSTTQFRTHHPLTVRCALCPWSRTGRAAAMLAAQRQHRLPHAQGDTLGPPAARSDGRRGPAGTCARERSRSRY